MTEKFAGRLFKNVLEKSPTIFHAKYKKHEILVNFLWKKKEWSVQVWDSKGQRTVDAGIYKDEYPTLETAVKYALIFSEL